MTVYFIKSKELGHIKIGFTENVEERMRGLAGLYGEIELLGLIDGDKTVESGLHEQFALFNVADAPGIEWFEDCPAIREYAKSHGIIPDDIPVTRTVQKREKRLDIGDGIVSKLRMIVLHEELKQRRRITQKEIAEATGLSKNVIARWMSDEPMSRFETATLAALCTYFGVKTKDMIYLAGIDTDGPIKR